MGGFGPMLGQNHHFSKFAPERLEYPTKRYQAETKRLYGVLNTHLQNREFVAGQGQGEYSIADMAIFPWMLTHEWQNIDLNEFPNVKTYFERIHARDAVQKALAISVWWIALKSIVLKAISFKIITLEVIAFKIIAFPQMVNKNQNL